MTTLTRGSDTETPQRPRATPERLEELHRCRSVTRHEQDHGYGRVFIYHVRCERWTGHDQDDGPTAPHTATFGAGGMDW